MFQVLVSHTFEKQFHAQNEDIQKRIRHAFEGFTSDPLTPRSGMDKQPLAATSPKKYRLRIGEYRMVYTVEESSVRVIELFTRGREY